MARLCGLLVVLLLLLTFNAYACVLPLPSSSVQMHCSSDADEPVRQTVRQTCDAFLELGPHSQFSSHHADSTFNLEYAVPVQLPDTFVFVSRADTPSTQCRYPNSRLDPNNGPEDLIPPSSFDPSKLGAPRVP